MEGKDNAYTINVSPHSNISTISAFELFHELLLAFTRPRITTYDRFLLFTCKQKENEKLEIFHCRLKALGAQCRRGTAEDDLIKDLFIAFMNNTIQSELLSETRTPAQVLHYALNKERGHENQRAIAGRLRETNIMDHQIAHIGSNQQPQQQRRPQAQYPRIAIQQQQRRPQQQKIKDNLTHVDYAEPRSHWNIFKSAPPKRHSAKIANEQVTLPKYAHQTHLEQQLTTTRTQQPPPRRIRTIREQNSTSSIAGEHNNTIEQAQETLDPESTYYFQEIVDSWNQVNHVKPRTFQKKNLLGLDASLNNEIWIKTKSNNIDIE